MKQKSNPRKGKSHRGNPQRNPRKGGKKVSEDKKRNIGKDKLKDKGGDACITQMRC
jgi:hypothetical protein